MVERIHDDMSMSGRIASDRPVADPSYSAFTREQEGQKQNRLQKLYQKYFPATKDSDAETVSGVDLHRGYFFLPALNERLVNNGGTVEDFRVAAEKLSQPMYFIRPEAFSPGIAERAAEALAQEYKIHLMPKSEYTPFVVEQLLKAMKTDPELRSSISQIKVINDDKKERDEVMPSIVIYTQLGKEQAQRALDRVYAHLEPYANLGDNRTPRYNQKVNDLIYYAQSGGDWKNDYLNQLTALGKTPADNTVFEPDLIHFKGDYHLRLPAKTTEPPVVSASVPDRAAPDIMRNARVIEEKDRAALDALRRHLGRTPSPEVASTLESLETATLKDGDMIDFQTENSQYKAVVYVDQAKQQNALRIVSGTGSIVGKTGTIQTSTIRSGSPLVFGDTITSKIAKLTVTRSQASGENVQIVSPDVSQLQEFQAAYRENLRRQSER